MEFFNKVDRRVARLEVSFSHSHIQLNWNGMLSPWYPQDTTNTSNSILEICSSSSKKQKQQQKQKKNSFTLFRLNGRIIPTDSFVSEEAPKVSFKISLDEVAQPGADFTNLVNDEEIIRSLEKLIEWKAPISQMEKVELFKSWDDSLLFETDYFVYDTQSIEKIQIASAESFLPKFQSQQKSSTSTAFKRLGGFFFAGKSQLPAVVHSKGGPKLFIYFLLITGLMAFLYLPILFYLSKMSSKRAVLSHADVVKVSQSTSVQLVGSKKSSPSSSSSSSLSPSSHTLLFTLSSNPTATPLLISSSDSNSV